MIYFFLAFGNLDFLENLIDPPISWITLIRGIILLFFHLEDLLDNFHLYFSFK